MSKTLRLLLLLLVAVAVAGGATYYLLSGEDEDGEVPSPSVAETTPPPLQFGVELTTRDFSFSTRLLTIVPGSEQMLVRLTNKGESPHTFGIQHPETFKRLFVSDRIPPGATRDIVVKRLPGDITEGATFPFFCSLHFNKGMRGVVLVTGGTGATPEPTDT